MSRTESKGCTEVLDRTSLGMRAVGGYTFCCQYLVAFPCVISDLNLGWCLIFAGSYNMLKKRGSEGGELNSGRTLLYAAEASQCHLFRSYPCEFVDIMLFRCCYRNTHQPDMGSESPDVYNTP